MSRRFTFAEMHRERDMRFWRNVIFCDEVSFQLFPNDRRNKVQRPKRQRNEQKYSAKSYAHQGGSLMFWGAINFYGQGNLVLVENSLISANYEAPLRRAIPPILHALGLRGAILIQDHAPCHDAQLVQNTLGGPGPRALPNYPANSPDLNPLDLVWDYWKTRVKRRNPQTLVQLRIFAYEE